MVIPLHMDQVFLALATRMQRPFTRHRASFVGPRAQSGTPSPLCPGSFFLACVFPVYRSTGSPASTPIEDAMG